MGGQPSSHLVSGAVSLFRGRPGAPGVDAALCKTKKTQCCRDALLRGRRASCSCVPVIGRAETPRPPSSAPSPADRQTDGRDSGPAHAEPRSTTGSGEEHPQPPPGCACPPAGWPAGRSTPSRPRACPQRGANGRLQYHPTDITGPLNLSDPSVSTVV
ncbi:hypothetical protein H8959_012123 [Pygathrix nigripes]